MREDFGLVNFNGKILAVGGDISSSKIKEVDEFIVATGQWQTLSNMELIEGTSHFIGWCNVAKKEAGACLPSKSTIKSVSIIHFKIST